MTGDTTYETRLCEHEILHEVRCTNPSVTARDTVVLLRTYSCTLHTCPYLTRACRVKETGRSS